MDPKPSDPAMDAEGFVMVPTTEPDKMEENHTHNPKQTSGSKRAITVRLPSKASNLTFISSIVLSSV
ncbi:hypothetical protein V6N12_016255 [Hibiscus sabdariffa]|uniref:Uncharacterized protein n=1 Tax=Hibiscus sabdariffa TaxID=183260 RepID=A0ABR2CF10_9ROSI